ncbi:hypothetical protein [Pseudomonas canadensis]|uniref:Uncharacterized protein n=1 Tax=Pseudomonas canadensis TaxID=915099 RepID=A0ABZ1ACP1_9PSED|nr:hypothetical protein [Pseudomonas canadensis]WRI26691.1 hypothetical protein SPL95_10355 [Pseudomonas canadensis]
MKLSRSLRQAIALATLQNPAGATKVLNVETPEIRAGLKDLKVGQSVVVTYTDTLEITTAHEG